MASVQRIRLGDNNVYVLDSSNGRVAIDCGPDYEGAWDALLGALDARMPGLVIATHGHLDHAGLGWRWQGAGVPVALGRADSRLVAQVQFSDEAELAAYASYVETTGAPADIQAQAFEAIVQRREWARRAAGEGYPPAPRGGRWPSALRMSPFEPVRLLRGDERLGHGLRVLASPGHTPGNVVVVTAEGWLFSGDQLLPGMTPTPAIQFVAGSWERFPSLPVFVASLQRLRAMGLTRCYPGHGEPFDNVDAVIEANLAQVEQRAERILELLRPCAELTVYEVAERLYPRALGRRFWQIVATVQGHLDLLADQQRASQVEGKYTLR
jgi:glyoxylase-like metal-dependent hydrolase (beta-lactamase superfamily II)